MFGHGQICNWIRKTCCWIESIFMSITMKSTKEDYYFLKFEKQTNHCLGKGQMREVFTQLEPTVQVNTMMKKQNKCVLS